MMTIAAEGFLSDKTPKGLNRFKTMALRLVSEKNNYQLKLFLDFKIRI